MKTRREFFKTLAGSCAVLAACVLAPKSLMAKEETHMIREGEVVKPVQFEEMDYVTSGYAQVRDYGELQNHTHEIAWTVNADTSKSVGDKFAWIKS